MLILIDIVDEDFIVFEQLVKMQSLIGGKRGSDSYATLESAVIAYAGLEKFSCIVTHYARVMTGSNVGLAGLLKEDGFGCITLHSIIQRGALCCKILQVSDVVQCVWDGEFN